MLSIDDASRTATFVIAVIIGFAALDAAEDIFAPMTLALVLGVVLAPLSDGFEKLGLGRVPATLLTIGVGIVALGGLLLFLGPVVQNVLDQAPRIWREMREVVGALQSTIRGLRDMSDEVAQAIDPAAAATGAAAGTALPRLTDALLFAPALAGQLVLFIGTLFFFILSREELYRWLARVLDQPSERGATARRLRQAERRVSRYFLTISLINTALGVAVAASMQMLGLPSPWLWGFVAALLNYILYLGPALVASGFVVAGIVAFDGFAAALPPLIYVALNLTEGQFVTPALVGRNMEVNPLLVFVSLVFWLWLWGPIGGFVAIPLLIWAIAILTPAERRQTISSETPGTSEPKSSAGAGS
jgi:predicted PurR-regulated permease PerM